MLGRLAATLFWVGAEEVWVEAATPVRTRATTKARTMSFMKDPFSELFRKLLINNGLEANDAGISGPDPYRRHWDRRGRSWESAACWGGWPQHCSGWGRKRSGWRQLHR